MHVTAHVHVLLMACVCVCLRVRVRVRMDVRVRIYLLLPLSLSSGALKTRLRLTQQILAQLCNAEPRLKVIVSDQLFSCEIVDLRVDSKLLFHLSVVCLRIFLVGLRLLCGVLSTCALRSVLPCRVRSVMCLPRRVRCCVLCMCLICRAPCARCALL
jgi:hypothetical protein